MCGCCTSNGIMDLTQTRSTSFQSSTSLLGIYSKFYNHKKRYEYISKIGRGAYGRVNLYQDKECRSFRYAIKTLKKNLLKLSSLNSIKNEVNIISSLDHPNIVKYFETYEDICYLHIVMEYVPGKTLHQIISEKKTFTEREISEITYCLLKAVLFLHLNGIVHRDIKPENILFSDQNDFSSLKLIDFGLSISESDGKETSIAGTPYYMAPESIKGKFSFESDVWSIGVIMYLLLTGEKPFRGENKTETFCNIIDEKYNKKLLQKQNCSDELKDLIKKILTANRKKRINSENALQHPLFSKVFKFNSLIIGVDPKYNIEDKIIDSMIAFTNKNLIQKEILYYISKISSDKELSKLRTAFNEIDIHRTGVIEIDEIEKLFKIKNRKENVSKIYDSLDFHNDKKIKYSEFIASTINSLEYVNEDRLLSAFRYFDVRDGGFITSTIFINVLKSNNVKVNESKLKKDFISLGYNNDNKIDFLKFKNLFYNNNFN